MSETIAYGYDDYGNIASRTVNINEDIVTYIYGADNDTGWTKLLTSYNKQNIKRDENSKPIYCLGIDLV